MAKRSRKKKRRRLSTEEIRQNSTSSSGSGGNWFTLPDGIDTWKPEKKGTMKLDIVPYVTTTGHPNILTRPPGIIPADIVWHMRPFRVHFGIGPDGIPAVCPGSIGEPCPVCEDVRILSKDYEENKKLIGDLRGQLWVAYNIIDPDDEDGIKVFAWSVGKFYNQLEKEIEESGDESLRNFFDVDGNGKTIKVRFGENSWQGKKFLETSKLDFVDRDEMDEDEILEKTVDLDTFLNVMEYDELQKLYLQVVGSSEDEDEEEEKKTKKKATKKSKKKEEPEEEEEDFDEDEWDDDDAEDDDWDDEGEEENLEDKEEEEDPEDDEDDDEWEDEDEEEEPEDDDEDNEDEWDDDDEWEDEDEEEEEPPPVKVKGPSACKACGGTGVSSSGGICSPCKGTGRASKKTATKKATKKKATTKTATKKAIKTATKKTTTKKKATRRRK